MKRKISNTQDVKSIPILKKRILKLEQDNAVPDVGGGEFQTYEDKFWVDSVNTLNGLDGAVSIIGGTNISVDILNPNNEIQINNTLSISALISNSSDTYTSVPEVVQVVTLSTTEYNNLNPKIPTTLYILVDPLP